jgi:catechol 2,3-dioxygenase-like lactoylglutathione lyase family enzyme
MRSIAQAVVIGFALIGVIATVQELRGQNAAPAAPLAAGTFTHVGIVVKDIAKASQLFADVYGVTPPAMPRLYNYDGAGIPFPAGVAGNRNARAKLAQFTAGNVRIELIEPEGGPTAWSEHLEKFGQGVHHLAFGVPNIDETIRGLQARGGKWVMGTGGQTFAYVDMKDQLGFTIEVGRQPQPQR